MRFDIIADLNMPQERDEARQHSTERAKSSTISSICEMRTYRRLIADEEVQTAAVTTSDRLTAQSPSLRDNLITCLLHAVVDQAGLVCGQV